MSSVVPDRQDAFARLTSLRRADHPQPIYPVETRHQLQDLHI